VASVLIGLAVGMSAPQLAWGAGTGGFAYSPLPNQAKPVNPGSIPGTTGGAAYVLRGQLPTPRHEQAEEVPETTDKDLESATDHVFPVQGKHSFGGKDARFGAGRPGHRHQGQDILADEGTPVAAPRGGTITWRSFQRKGAGYYLVLEAVMEPYTYVFMHLQRGSLQARVGDRVRSGQVLGAVGSTGSADGPHLHFEIWRGRWAKGGEPIDPLPYLAVWDAIS
jgi:murein DD-endopeptidase MepM/ murein hydrolase activator NlpD